MFTVIVLVGLLVNIELASAIRCYECSTQNNSMCEEPSRYDEETRNKYLPLTDCSRIVHGSSNKAGHQFFCRKIMQLIRHNVHDPPEQRIFRSCGWKKDHRACYKTDNADHYELVCQCFNDRCNGANTVHVAMATLASAAIMILALSKT